MGESRGEFLPRDAIANPPPSIRKSQNQVQSEDASGDRSDDEGFDVGVKAIINVVVETRRFTRTVGVEDSRLLGVLLRSSKASHLGTRGGRCQFDLLGEKMLYSGNGIVAVPQVAGQMFATDRYVLPIRRTVISPKRQSRREEDVTKDDKALHADDLRVPFAVPESPGDVVVAEVDLFVGVISPEIID